MGRRQRRRTHASTCQLKSSSWSSQEVVLNNEDLLTLILLRVPWKSRLSLKCVSKQWRSLIFTANASRYSTRLSSLPPLRTSGLFFQYSTKLYFIHLDDPNTPSPFNPKRMSIEQSCNGLFLSRAADIVSYLERDYYVCNPCTNQVDTLPKHPCHNRVGIPSMALAYHPLMSHYKVIAFLERPRSSPASADVGDFYIYSSETGTWRDSLQSYYPPPNMWFRGGVYWKGGMHWLSKYSKSRHHVSYCMYFNVDEERLEAFPGPPTSIWSLGHSYFGESEDHLHYVEVCPYDASFNVYEMKSDYSGWFVKYQIDLVPISKVFRIMKKGSCFLGESFNAGVASIVRRENFKEDSFLVLELPGQMIRYNLVDKSFKVIWNFGVDLKVSFSLRHWFCGRFKAWPYKP